jgi:dTDP-4-dehydrorhamnose reductase
MKILVTGRKGQLGSEIHKISANYNYEWIFTNRHSFNFSDLDNIIFFLNKCKPEIIINCAAYTMVENAEDDFELADIINNKAVELMAKWSNINNCKLIHISTDYVFDGNSLDPYVETDETNPLNNYGKSKLLGDLACIKYNPPSIIIRTSWLYSSFGDNFLINMLNVMKNSNKIEVVNDQFGSPTYAADLAKFILQIINTNCWRPGVYNYTNKGSISWYDFAKKIKSICNFKTIINSVSSEYFYQKVKRPKYSVLDNSKTISTFNIKQIDYLDSLRKCIKILENET